ncbi:MAG: VOC family protein [Pseudomonadota bacterium]
MAKVNHLVYALFEVKDLDKWRGFIPLLYGLELKPSPQPDEYEVVIDDAGYRLIFRQGPADDIVCVGWFTEELDGMKTRLDEFGAQANWMDATYTKMRGAGRILQTEDPTGLLVDIVDRTASHNAFTESSHDHTYVTGGLGFGHLTFASEDHEGFERFYTEALGLKTTDYNSVDLIAGLSVKVGFYRTNARHHSIACATLAAPGQRLNHFFLEVTQRGMVDAAYKRVTDAKVPIAHRIGVHPNDNLYTFYALSPSGFQAELGTEGRLVEDDHDIEYVKGMSVWGHEMPLAQKLRMAKLATRAIGRQFSARLSSASK